MNVIFITFIYFFSNSCCNLDSPQIDISIKLNFSIFFEEDRKIFLLKGVPCKFTYSPLLNDNI